MKKIWSPIKITTHVSFLILMSIGVVTYADDFNGRGIDSIFYPRKPQAEKPVNKPIHKELVRKKEQIEQPQVSTQPAKLKAKAKPKPKPKVREHLHIKQARKPVVKVPDAFTTNLSSGNLSVAFKIAQMELRKEPESVFWRKRLAAVAIKQQNYSFAWQQISKVAMNAPTDENLNWAINFSGKYGNLEDLMALLDYVMIYHKVNKKIWIAYVDKLDKLNKHEKASTLLQYILEKVPQSDKARIGAMLTVQQHKANKQIKVREALKQADFDSGRGNLSQALENLKQVEPIAAKSNKQFWTTYKKLQKMVKLEKSVALSSKPLITKTRKVMPKANDFSLVKPVEEHKSQSQPRKPKPEVEAELNNSKYLARMPIKQVKEHKSQSQPRKPKPEVEAELSNSEYLARMPKDLISHLDKSQFIIVKTDPKPIHQEKAPRDQALNKKIKAAATQVIYPKKRDKFLRENESKHISSVELHAKPKVEKQKIGGLTAPNAEIAKKANQRNAQGVKSPTASADSKTSSPVKQSSLEETQTQGNVEGAAKVQSARESVATLGPALALNKSAQPEAQQANEQPAVESKNKVKLQQPNQAEVKDNDSNLFSKKDSVKVVKPQVLVVLPQPAKSMPKEESLPTPMASNEGKNVRQEIRYKQQEKKKIRSYKKKILLLNAPAHTTTVFETSHFYPTTLVNYKAGSDNIPQLYSDVTTYPPYNEISPEVQYIQNGVVEDVNSRFGATFFYNPNWSFSQLVSVSNFTSANKNQLLVNQNAEVVAALTASYYYFQDIFDFHAGYVNSIREFAEALFKANITVNPRLLFIGRLGYNQRPYETSALFVAGKKELADFLFKYLIHPKLQFSADVVVKTFFTQDDFYLGWGAGLLLDLQRRFHTDFVDVATNVFVNLRKYDQKSGANVPGAVMPAIFPVNNAGSMGQVMPPSAYEGGVGITFGNAKFGGIAHKWRPFASAQVFGSTVVDVGYFFNAGFSGYVFGSDRLTLYASGSRGIEVAQNDYSVKLAYYYYF